MTRLRRLLGLLALAGALRWAVVAVLQRSALEHAAAPVYPNDYGVRLRPLTRAETAAALALEHAAYLGLPLEAPAGVGSAASGLAGGPQAASTPGAA